VPKVGFKYSALYYLNQWISKDRRYYQSLAGNDESEKLQVLQDAATFYRVARNLPVLHDEGRGLRRYKPVLDIIDAQTSAAFQGEALLPSIKRVRDAISAQYGGREVLSLTTKFLWLRIRSPIIIYDSQARKALDAPLGNIHEFYSQWREMFKRCAQEIDAACTSLQDVGEYVADPIVATPRYIAEMASQQWFRERVLDVYLWHRGGDA